MSVEITTTPVEETKTVEETTPEFSSAAARKQLDRERQFQEERAAFRKEQEEAAAKLDAYQKATENARFAPIEHLKSLGLEGEDLLDVARVIMYDANPDLVTPEIKSKVKDIHYNNEIRRLRAEMEAAKAKPEDTGPPKELVEYQNSIIESAKTPDSKKYPLVAKYVSRGESSAMEVASEMYAIAQRAASNQENPKVLKPEETMAQLEARLKSITELANTAPKDSESTETLTNAVTQAAPTEQTPGNMSLQEKVERARARMQAKLREHNLLE